MSSNSSIWTPQDHFSDPRILVVTTDGNGKIIHQQDYYEYQYGNRSREISLEVFGQKFADILIDQTGTIQFDENGPRLAMALSANIKDSAMRLLGRIAEAVIVRRCNEGPDINYKYFNKARQVSSWHKTADKYKAIGTGLLTTQQLYPGKYNPTDPQRDIVWIGKDGKLAFSGGGTKIAGTVAGLQIKVSTVGKDYILDDLLRQRYEVPMVYFPINNDFDYLAGKLYEKHATVEQYGYVRPLVIDKDFINVKSIDPGAFDEVKSYEGLCMGLLDGDFTLNDLLNFAYREKKATLKKAIMDETLEKFMNNSAVE